MPYRVGFDVGGTFTDLVLQAPTGELTTGKRLTTYPDPSAACLAGLDELLGRAGVAWADVVQAVPEGPDDLYRQAVAASMLDDRQRALAELARRGVLTIDAGPSGLTVAVVNKYLELKSAAKV